MRLEVPELPVDEGCGRVYVSQVEQLLWFDGQDDMRVICCVLDLTLSSRRGRSRMSVDARPVLR